MSDRSDGQIKRLQEELRHLREENEILTEKAEDIYLLGVIAEKLCAEKTARGMVSTLLEALVTLKELSYAAFLEGTGARLTVSEDFGLYLKGSLRGRSFTFPSPLQEVSLTSVSHDEPLPSFFPEWTVPMDPNAFLFLPLVVRENPIGVFLFINSIGESSYLERLMTLICRVRDLLSARLESISCLQEVEELNETLNRRVEERTAALQAVNTRLREEIKERKQAEAELIQAQKMEAIGRFAGGIAHDFNNLLTAILGYSELLLLDRSPASRDYEEIRTIRETAERAAQLTRQILAFSKRQVMEPVLLDLNEILQNMGKMWSRILGEDVDFIFLPGKDLPQVKADPGQVEQIILNLVINARDAMPEGGCLTIATEEVLLDEGYCRMHGGLISGSYLLIRVSDTGVGMTEEIRSHIYEPFYTTKQEGTGLGLSTVYGIMEQLKGHLDVSSEVGKGTTFRGYLPAWKGDEEAAGERAAIYAKTLPGGSETILVIEDSPHILKLTEHILTQLGYSVISAPDADAVAPLLAGHDGAIDLLLTDVVMPGKSGPEIAGELVLERPSMKIIFMSGYADDRVAGLNHPDRKSSFLPKPFTSSELARKVRSVLDG